MTRSESVESVAETISFCTMTGPESKRGEMFVKYSSDIFKGIEEVTIKLREHIDNMCAPEDLV